MVDNGVPILYPRYSNVEAILVVSRAFSIQRVVVLSVFRKVWH